MVSHASVALGSIALAEEAMKDQRSPKNVTVRLLADDNTLRLQFSSLKSTDDLANLLDVEPR